MPAPSIEYRLDVSLVDLDDRPHVALWLDPDGAATRALFVTRLLADARRVYGDLVARRRPPELGVDLASGTWRRLDVSPVRVFRRFDGGRFDYRADLEGTVAHRFELVPAAVQPELD